MSTLRPSLPHAAALALALAAAAWTASSAAADGLADAAAVAAARRTIAAAAFAEPAVLAAARAEIAASSAAHPGSARLHYWTAYADYRLAPRLLSDDKKAAGRWIDDGIAHLDRALKLEPEFAEAIALKASLQGLSISVKPMRAMSLGGEIEEHLERARALAPENPRVALIEGINAYNKPGFVGGGPKPALAKLLEAQRKFAAAPESADSTAIDWGHDDAYAWAGRASAKLGDAEAARAAYDRALALNPNNGWVAHVLRPQLEKSLAAGKKP